ncbi:MAG: hypothetical protein ACLT2Z_09665 [Eubacterium sp.]
MLNSAVVDNGKDGINNRKSVNGVKNRNENSRRKREKYDIDDISNTGRSSESLKTKAEAVLTTDLKGKRIVYISCLSGSTCKRQ